MGCKFLMNLVWISVLGCIFFLIHGFNCDKAPFYTFLHEARTAPAVSYYDYIIIGGGTSGCALAATLSEKASVLVLERGGSPYDNPNITNMENFALTLSDMSPTSPTQQFISEDGVYNARARVLGGGTALNAGFYTRAESGFIQEVGWNVTLVNQSYEWVEKKVAFKPNVLQWQMSVKDGLLEVGVLPYNGFSYDHINGTKIGGSIFDRYGHRHTAADLLEYATPTNIVVYLHATTSQILFTPKGKPWPKPRAYGVIFEDALGFKRRALLRANDKHNEIILAAGALGSPQLLMLSGIGPGYHLRAHGIPVVVDQPMVGQGMADNPMNILFIPSPLPIEVSLIQVVGITEFGSYIEATSGLKLPFSWYPSFAKEYENFLNQTGAESTLTREAMAKESISNSLLNLNFRGGVILEKITGPLSKGELKLRTTSPYDNPAVKFNYFDHPEDLKRCVQGMKTIIEVINSRAFSKFRFKTMPVEALINIMVNLPLNLRSRHVSAAFDMEQFCIDTVLTIWHYHGGCIVGQVVDNDYKVIGVDGLRVVDGSTFASSPGTNPQATVMMLGRYMGRKILEGIFRIKIGLRSGSMY